MKTIYAAAAFAAALFVAPASAQDRAPLSRSQAVTHADLNLQDVRDVARFDLRIARTARALCGEASTLDMVGRRKDRACVAAAVTRVADARARALGMSGATMVAER